MMKIEKLLTISEKKKSNGKMTEVARVGEFDDEERKQIDKSKFKKGQSNRGVERLESKCFVILKEDFENLEAEFKSKIKSLEDAIADKDKSIEELQNQLSDIDEEHSKNKKKIDNEYAEEVKQLKADLHEKELEIERTKTKYEKKIGELKLFDENAHMSIIDHQKAISELTIFNPEYHMKISDHEKALNKMRGNCLKLRVRENKEYSSYIEELDKLGRLAKFRNKDKAILKEMRGYNLQTIDEEAIDVNFNLIDKNSGRADE